MPGPRPDLQLLEQSGRLGRLPAGVAGLGDGGDQAIDKRHPNAYRPRKKPPGKDRPTQDVAYNTAFARRRIIVENSNARLRRYQRLSQTDRNHRQNHSQRVPAVAGLVNRVDALTLSLPPHVQAELSQLVGLLCTAAGRRGLAGLDTDWPAASAAQVQAALEGMRYSSLALRQQTYQALHEIVGGAYFSDTSAWSALGYPGPVLI